METADLIKILKKELVSLQPKAQSGESDAQIEFAIGKALCEFMLAGYKLTDLEWFKGTTLYTGDRLTLDKAA